MEYTKGQLITMLDDVHDLAHELDKNGTRDVADRLYSILGGLGDRELAKTEACKRQRELDYVHGPGYDANGTWVDH